MRTTPHALFVILFLLVGLPLLAQQPTKTKTKKGNTRNTTDTTQMSADTAAMRADTTMMQGGGGGMGAEAFPYTATYSSQFTLGNPAYARMVLSLWKDYDNNMLDRTADMFADTVLMQTPNGQLIRGRDSVMMAMKQMRGQYTTVKSTVEAFVPMHSTDRNEDFVLVWGQEDDTGASGNTSSLIHEVWGINRDGKVFFVRQYVAKPSMQ